MLFLFFVWRKNNLTKRERKNRSEFFKEAEAERARDDKIRFCHRKREKRERRRVTQGEENSNPFPSLLYAKKKKKTKKNDVNDDRDNKSL